MTQGLLDEHVRRAARAYGAAADHYCHASLWFLGSVRCCDRVAAAAGAGAGGAGLALWCFGAGSSAIPAARAVGPQGTVPGMDVAAPLLEAGRARGERRVWPTSNSASPTPDPPDSRAARSTRSCASLASSSPRMCRHSWPRCGGLCAQAGAWRSRLGGPICSSPRTVCSGKPSGRSSRRCSRRSIRGMRSPQPRLWSACSHARGSAVRLFEQARAGTISTIRAASGMSSWDPATEPTVEALTPEQRDALHDRLAGMLRAHSVRRLRTDVVFGTAIRR